MLIRHHPLPCDAPGTQRQLQSLHFEPTGPASDAPPKVYIQASLHADEVPAMLVAHHLRERLAAAEAEGRLAAEITLVPMANPIGLSQRLLHGAQGRFDLASGENFNRHFADLGAVAVAAAMAADLAHDPLPPLRRALRQAADALPAPTELQALRRTLLGLAIDADIVLDLHCDNEAVLHLYSPQARWDDAEPLARLLGAELALLAARSGGDPFDEACSSPWQAAADAWAQRGGAPVRWPGLAVTVELRGEADVADALARHDADALMRFLAHCGCLVGDDAALPPLKRAPRPLAGSIPVLAPTGGVLVFRSEVGDQLAAGDTIAELVCPLRGLVTPVTSPVDGLLYARDHRRYVPAGARIAKVAGTEARRHGALLSA
ncbi:succinylglutamate desuccinylase/aspartoacylase family protein [Aquabacterium humicola]|uniref:succinylglutamate desuccinylase/aspartoacylase family protein n=1 Tax=Aquabacterium humicola TaxID=3237377 RepID=UPI002542E40A|nr:succinylglutamate desuccinylase/aspartoacylase family protein [Rubrivivax pictus]